MPQTGDNVAVEYGVTREDADQFAAASQAKYEAAKQTGFFAGEIVGVEVPQGRKLPPKLVDQDEHPRPSSNLEALQKLRPLFEGGVVTAGNASGVNDGAAALIIGSEAAQENWASSQWRKSLLLPLRVLSHALWVRVRLMRSN